MEIKLGSLALYTKAQSSLYCTEFVQDVADGYFLASKMVAAVINLVKL